MRKIILAFPDHESLWQFKNQTQAVNIAITPKKNIISVAFSEQEVELAVDAFKATTISNASSSTEKQVPVKTRSNWLKNYSIGNNYGRKSLRRVVNSIHSFFLV